MASLGKRLGSDVSDDDLPMPRKCSHLESQPTCSFAEVSNETRSSSSADEGNSDNKNCYHSSQETIAQRIYDKINLIMNIHSEKYITDYTDFDFMIYIPPLNLLEEQTIDRLCDKTAKCFNEERYKNKDELRMLAKSRVNKYIKTDEIIKHLKELQAEAKASPHKLFLVVADEAHWGITKVTNKGNKGAQNEIINAWDNSFSNVIVLLVSATPWNLLTSHSRISKLDVVKNKENGKFMKSSDQTQSDRSTSNLYICKWTENWENRLEQGLVVVMRVPQRIKEPTEKEIIEYEDDIWLYVKKCGANFFLSGTSNKSEATPLLLFGSDNFVTITTENKEYTLAMIRTGKKFKLMFLKFDPENVPEIAFIKFRVSMKFGENVFEFQPEVKPKQAFQLKYDYDEKRVIYGDIAQYIKNDNSLRYHSKEYIFLVENHRNADESKCDLEYLSLNFYYNTMRNKEVTEQLIRGDTNFQKMLKHLLGLLNKGKVKGDKEVDSDEILTAEYAYYIILTHCLKKYGKDGLIPDMFDSLKYYVSTREKLLQEFENKLDKTYDIFSTISLSVFKAVRAYIENTSKKRIEIIFDENAEDTTESFISYLLHAHYDTFQDDMNKLKQILADRADSIDFYYLMFNQQKEEILSVFSETFRIVNDFTLLEAPVKKGRMKVVRVNDISNGKRFVKTLTLAREVGAGDDKFGNVSFEIIPCFELLHLSKIKEINPPCVKIWQKTQCKPCRNITRGKVCKCGVYRNDEKTMVCTDCKHQHYNITQFSDLENMPSIVVLVQKGKMGDTFPSNFHVMDLRLKNHATKPKLTRAMQEFGRMCRYTNKSDYSTLPYALVGPTLLKSFEEYLPDIAAFQCSFSKKEEDDYTKLAKTNISTGKKSTGASKSSGNSSEVKTDPTEKSYDHENKDRLKNRILLQAEPQIGKTGVYMKLISLMQRSICSSDN